jgi:Ca2+-binding RTX toxin-like protein
MVLVPDTELGLWMGDNSSELITLFPGQLTGFPLGVLTLGGEDTVEGSVDSELIIVNQDDDLVLGGNGNDTIFGGQGNDLIDGDLNNDLIFGDLGNDTIIGGAGNDQFVIGPGFGLDIINDYGRDTDSLLLQGNITEADLEFVTSTKNIGFQNPDVSVIVRSTGETIAILRDISLEEFNSIKIVEPLIL